ncbi:MAG: RIP metalloprotease RseP [Candidatus Brocadiia bacterium]
MTELFGGLFSNLSTVLIMLVGVGILIFVHELGHFIVAKRSKIRVEVFSLGMGPKIWGFQKGETFYRIGLLPLGGYVRMAGENLGEADKPKADYEFAAKPPMVRAQVFAAGAIMNFLLAFPACMLAFMIGLNFAVPVVGYIIPNSTEWESDIQKGDRITAVVYGDKEMPINNVDMYRREVLRAKAGTLLNIKVQRNGQELIVPVKAQGSTKLGILPAHNIVMSVMPGSGADKSGLKPNDEIIIINGEAVSSGREIDKHVYQNPGKPLAIKVRRPTGQKDQYEMVDLTVTPDTINKGYYDTGMPESTPPIIGAVKMGSPAHKAGLKPGDRVLSVNGDPVKSSGRLMEIIKANPGKELLLKVHRAEPDGKYNELALTALPAKDTAGNGYMMFFLADSNEIGDVKPGSPAEKTGLQSGDKIVSVTIDNSKALTVTGLALLAELSNRTKGLPIDLTIDRNGTLFTSTLTAKQFETQGAMGIELKAATSREQYPFFTAVAVGFNEAIDLVSLTVELIWKLFSREESMKGMAGPIGIFQASWYMLQEGISKFIWLLALFSINLGILNLLPVPILDGGGILFMIIEKLKGKPVSVTTQAISQYVGLFLLLSLVIFASYNDISRWVSGG